MFYIYFLVTVVFSFFSQDFVSQDEEKDLVPVLAAAKSEASEDSAHGRLGKKFTNSLDGKNDKTLMKKGTATFPSYLKEDSFKIYLESSKKGKIELKKKDKEALRLNTETNTGKPDPDNGGIEPQKLDIVKNDLDGYVTNGDLQRIRGDFQGENETVLMLASNEKSDGIEEDAKGQSDECTDNNGSDLVDKAKHKKIFKDNINKGKCEDAQECANAGQKEQFGPAQSDHNPKFAKESSQTLGGKNEEVDKSSQKPDQRPPKSVINDARFNGKSPQKNKDEAEYENYKKGKKKKCKDVGNKT